VPQISVVIPTLGNPATLERVLDGYGAQDAPPGSFEVIVAVDAAEPEPESVGQAIGRRAYPVRRVTGAVPGASANRNAGWLAARCPLILFTDDDTVPVPRLVSEHLSWHARHPAQETGVLGHVRWAPELEVTTFMRWLDRGIQFDLQSIDGTDATWGRFASANASLKRAFLEHVGGFDQDHFPYGYEDTDWAYRASGHGFVLLYNRAAIVDHLRTMDLEFWKKRVRRVAVAEQTFTRLHPELPPWFHRLYSEALTHPRPRGRALRLAPYVPQRLPWLGERVWRVVDLGYRQALAPSFLEAWDAAAAAEAGPLQPDLSEFADPGASSGDPPSGPK